MGIRLFSIQRMKLFALIAVLFALAVARERLPGINGEWTRYLQCIPDRHFPFSLPCESREYVRRWSWYSAERIRRIREEAEAEARLLRERRCGRNIKWNCGANRCRSHRGFVKTNCCDGLPREC